ncbi:MAG: hypothetical protein Q7T44_18250 [Parvibaculum sp.]|nr:hypothetical protein [Parvibaculum sp.]
MTAKKVRFRTALRHLLRFQLKLALDALRDLLMSPISVICFQLDMLLRPDEAQSYRRAMIMFGRKTDRWINLFGEHRRDEETVQVVEEVPVVQAEEPGKQQGFVRHPPHVGDIPT